MSNQRIGFSGTTLEQVQNSPTIRKTNDTPEVTEVFNVNYDDAEAAITARGVDFGDDCPIVDYADAKLSEITIQKAGPQNALVSYIYRVPDGSGPQPVGTIIQEADSNAIEIPIAQLGTLSPGVDYDPKKQVGIGDLEGVESVLSPQPVYSRTEIVSSFTFSEANIISNVAKIHTGAQMNAQGLSAASDGKWLKVGLTVRQQGSNFSKGESYQYAENGWNSDLYGAAT